MYTSDCSMASVPSIGHGYNTDTGGYNVQAGDNGPGGDTSIDTVAGPTSSVLESTSGIISKMQHKTDIPLVNCKVTICE